MFISSHWKFTIGSTAVLIDSEVQETGTRIIWNLRVIIFVVAV